MIRSADITSKPKTNPPSVGLTALLGLSIALLLPNRSWSEDWSQYRGPRGDGKSAEAIGDLPSPIKELTVTWKTPTPLGFSSFSVADGRAFTIIAKEAGGETKEWLLAVDSESGQELWSVPLGSSEYGHDGGNAGAPNNRGGDGPRSTPSTDGQHVYVYDSHLLLACFDATNGQPVWKRDIVSEFDGRNIKWLNATSPLMDENFIYVGGGGPGQSFLAFDKLAGDVVWKTGDEQITHATPHCATIEGTKQVIFFVQSGLVSLEASTGKQLWAHQTWDAVLSAVPEAKKDGDSRRDPESKDPEPSHSDSTTLPPPSVPSLDAGSPVASLDQPDAETALQYAPKRLHPVPTPSRNDLP
ncbi:MAG: PQQ-binding-like beta-propeller repeat protein [Verrucomicrobiota bacterium]